MIIIKNLSIDLEVYSDVDLAKCGVYKYAESSQFEILLFGCSIDGGEVRVFDIASGETLPPEIIDALTDENVVKWAFNANFERVCLSRYLTDIGVGFKGKYLDPRSWRCSMVWASTLGLPRSLKDVGAVLGLEKQKLTEGKDLIKYFCVPCRPTRTNGGRTRNMPADAPDKWTLFKEYNKRDVEVETQIKERLSRFPVPEFVWDEFALDQEINDRGVMLDMDLVKKAIEMDARSKEEITAEMKRLTGLENPNSVIQMKDWLALQGLPTDTLDKKAVTELLMTAPPELSKVLKLRQQISKSSVKKYTAMQNAVCKDGRARGMFAFYGATRTGRFAGRLIQLQNLRQNHLPDLASARALVKSGDYAAVKMLYGDVPDTLSQLVRTAFVPENGKLFYVADYSAIEARVISWYAGETWKSEAFANGEDIYCSTASRMFGVPVVKHGVNGELRQKGKIAELACIAEDELVLTNHGLIPIQDVTTKHLVWDGTQFVRHDGVVYRGVKEVMTYDGLTATPDHMVYVSERPKPVCFAYAALMHMHLLRVSGTHAVRRSGSLAKVYDIVNAGEHHRYTVSGVIVHNCGYGGSVGALKSMGALDMGLSEDELKPIVDSWRSANPHIVQFWWNVNKAVHEAVSDRHTSKCHGLTFTCRAGMLFITLPSGRKLAYPKPAIGMNRFGSPCVTFEGTGPAKHWERIESYGPKFVENIVQATARDILCYAMKTLKNTSIVMHVHDELIIEADPAVSLDAICEQMSRTPPWAEGLVLRADGYTTPFYRKD